MYQNLRDIAKELLRRKCMASNAYIEKGERLKINKLKI